MPITRAVEIAFRVAAGPRLGFGHLARCRTLAGALGVRPRMSIRGTAATRQAARRLGVTLLSPNPGQVLRRVDVLVVDDPSLAAGRRWVTAGRRAGVRVVAIHDAAPYARAADLVVDGSPRTPATTSGRTRGGPAFAVLDPRIADRRRRARSTRTLVVALGGGGHGRRWGATLVAALGPTAAGTVRVASGFTAGRRPALAGGRWLEPADLAAALAGARVAVVGGGLTALEAAALGVPSVAVAVVPAQRPAIRALARRGVVLDGGAISDPGAIARVAAQARRLWASPSRRRRLAANGRRLVDGRGADRIAAAIHGLLAAEVVP